MLYPWNMRNMQINPGMLLNTGKREQTQPIKRKMRTIRARKKGQKKKYREGRLCQGWLWVTWTFGPAKFPEICLEWPNVLESTRTLTARKPLNFGNSESLTQKLGKSDSETRKTDFWVCVSEFLRRSFWVARFCPKKSGTKTPKMRPTTVVFWTFCANAKTARNCPTRKLCLGNSETLPRKLRNSDFLSFWVGVSEFLSWSFWVSEFGGFLIFRDCRIGRIPIHWGPPKYVAIFGSIDFGGLCLKISLRTVSTNNKLGEQSDSKIHKTKRQLKNTSHEERKSATESAKTQRLLTSWLRLYETHRAMDVRTSL